MSFGDVLGQLFHGLSGSFVCIAGRIIVWLLSKFGKYIWRWLVALGKLIWRGIVGLFKKIWAILVAVIDWFKHLFKGKKQPPKRQPPKKPSGPVYRRGSRLPHARDLIKNGKEYKGTGGGRHANAPCQSMGGAVTPEENEFDRPMAPRFFADWKDLFGKDGEDFAPIDYLNQPENLPFVIAAQWLFSPRFVEYRGCIVVNYEIEEELSGREKQTIDEWFNVLGGNISRIEAKVNLLTFKDLFMACDLAPHEDDLSALARTVARCWEGLLGLQFPERDLQVDVYDDEKSYGPEITFFSRGAAAARTRPAANRT